MHGGESSPGGRIPGIECNRAFEEVLCFFESLLSPIVHAPPATQKVFVSLDGGGLAAHGAAFARIQRVASQQRGDRLGNLVLHGEHIDGRTLELL